MILVAAAIALQDACVPVGTYWISPSVILHVLWSPHVPGRVMPLRMKVKVKSTLSLAGGRCTQCGEATLVACRLKLTALLYIPIPVFKGKLPFKAIVTHFLFFFFFKYNKGTKIHSRSHVPSTANKSMSRSVAKKKIQSYLDIASAKVENEAIAKKAK